MTDFHGEFKVYKDAADLTRQMAELILRLLGDSIRSRGRAGLMKIAIYFGGKLILFLFHPPPPPNPLPQGEGGLSLS